MGRSVTRCRNARGMTRWQQKGSTRSWRQVLVGLEFDSSWPMSGDLRRLIGCEERPSKQLCCLSTGRTLRNV